MASVMHTDAMATEVEILQADRGEWCELRPAGLIVHGKPSFSEWQSLCDDLQSMRRCLPWWIGDLLNAGERIYGESYAQAINATGMETQTLYNYTSVCKRVPIEARQANLSFTHHAMVAYRNPDQQGELLRLAAANGWSTSELRAGMAEMDAKPTKQVDAAEANIINQTASVDDESVVHDALPMPDLDPGRTRRETFKMEVYSLALSYSELSCLRQFLDDREDALDPIMVAVKHRVDDLALSA